VFEQAFKNIADVEDPILADSMLRLECEAVGVEVIDDLPAVAGERSSPAGVDR